MSNEEFQPTQQKKLTKKQREKQEKEFKASAKRNIALGIMPALVRAHPDLPPSRLVKRAYGIADQMLIQGDKL